MYLTKYDQLSDKRFNTIHHFFFFSIAYYKRRRRRRRKKKGLDKNLDQEK
jgi:hypothetical protein